MSVAFDLVAGVSTVAVVVGAHTTQRHRQLRTRLLGMAVSLIVLIGFMILGFQGKISDRAFGLTLLAVILGITIVDLLRLRAHRADPPPGPMTGR